SCLAVFGAAGAITSARGAVGRAAAAPERPPPGEPTTAPRKAESKPEASPAERAAPPAESTSEAAAATARPTERPIPAGTVPPRAARAGGESSIAQRLDRETSAGGLTLRALGAAKTSQGDRSVLAIYVRLQNDGDAPIRVDPTYFKLNDRGGA